MTKENKETPSEVVYALGEIPRGTLTFCLTEAPVPVLEFQANGDIYIRGKLAANDPEIVEAMREFFRKVRQ